MYRYKDIDVTVTGYHGCDGVRPMYCFELCRSCVIKTFLSIISELPLTVLYGYVSISDIFSSDGKKMAALDMIDKLCVFVCVCLFFI